MEIKTSQKFCIITPLTPKMDLRETARLMNEIQNFSDKTIGIDLSFVEDCTIEFIEAIKKSKAGIFNIHSDIFSIFNFMNLDKCINLFNTEEDFMLNKRRLLNRKFCII